RRLCLLPQTAREDLQKRVWGRRTEDRARIRLRHLPSCRMSCFLVAAGQAEIGIYPASEVTGVEGLIIVGPLPAEINLEIVYGAAVTIDSAAPNAAFAFVKFMAAPANRPVGKEGGFEARANSNSNWSP